MGIHVIMASPDIDTIVITFHISVFFFAFLPLACSLAELVDNALSATAKNTGVRTIEIRLVGALFGCY